MHCCYNMCSRTQYKHNVRAAAQCVEVSWTSAFLLPRALTDVLFLLFVPSALRGVQHVTICTFSILQELFVVHLLFFIKLERVPWFLGPKNWDGLGSAGGGLPSTSVLGCYMPVIFDPGLVVRSPSSVLPRTSNDAILREQCLIHACNTI